MIAPEVDLAFSFHSPNHNRQVAVTPVFHGRQRKRRLPEEEEKEDGGGDKKVKKEENDNVYRIHAKNFRKADEEQGEIKEMEQMGVEGSKQDEKEKLSKSIKRSNEVVATVGKEGPSPPSIFGQRGPKLLNGSSPASAGLIPRAHPQQSPWTAKMVPKTALKQVCKCTQTLKMIKLDYSFSGGRRQVGEQGGDKRGVII